MENDNQTNNKNVSLSLIAEYGGSDSESDDTTNVRNDDSDASELSEMVLKNNIINACAHGPLSRAVEDDENSRTMIIDASGSDIGYEVTLYREEESDTETSSSGSDSDVDSVKDVEENSSGDEETRNNKAAKLEAPKVNGELHLEDLPPIEDLAISLPSQEALKIGTVASIVEQLVVVKGNQGTPAVDLESVLFLDNGAKALGKVFDVFGPVKEPHYAVRFNSHQHVVQRGVTVGQDVFIGPDSQHTSYVFLPDLMKMKGSDASWKNDLEPPPSQIDYSDDEEERRARREAKQRNNEDNNPDNKNKNTRNNRPTESSSRFEDNSENNGENSKKRNNTNRNNRPSESSSRFGSGPSRIRNPFSAGSRRNNPNTFPRFARPFMDLRTPPPHPNDPNTMFGQPPNFPIFPPPFNPSTPPPFMYQFPRMAPMRVPAPIFGAPFCNMSGPQPQWVNTEPPPPPGT